MELVVLRPSAIVRGSVIARTERGLVCRYVVWRCITALRAVALPIRQREAAHRGDVPVSRLDDLRAMGLPGGSWVIVATVPRFLQPAIRIGEVPPDVWGMIEDARRSDIDSRRIDGTSSGQQARL